MDENNNLTYDRTYAFTASINVTIVKPEPKLTRTARIRGVIQGVDAVFSVAA
jgi:hypothetical protein